MPLVTKQEAVRQLIEDALDAFPSHRLVSAITLLGAAEEAMPPADPRMFQMLKLLVAGPGRTNLDEIGQSFNRERNWLKYSMRTTLTR